MSLVSWKDFDGSLRRGRLLREEGTRAIVEFASGSEGYDRTTVISAASIIDPQEERIRHKLEYLRDTLQLEDERHQSELDRHSAAVSELERRLRKVQAECRHRWSAGFCEICSADREAHSG